VLVWQYQLGCFPLEIPRRQGEEEGRGVLAAAFDMDLATEDGYEDMW
jgi:hypothetical protein